MNEQTRGTIEMTMAMVISGTIGWLVLASGQPVMEVIFWRCLFGALTLLAVCAAMGLLKGLLSPRLLLLGAAGGVAIVFNWVLLFGAYPKASISIATAVYNTQPFMLVALGTLFLGETLTARKLFWLGLAFVGMLLIVQADPDGGYAGTDYLVGILMSLGAAFCYAVAAILAKKLAGHKPHLIALIHVGVGIVMMAPFTNFTSLPTEAGTWAILLTIGVVHTGFMYILLYGAIQRLPTHLTGSLSFIYPVVAIVVDMLVFGHHLQWMQIGGAAAILLAAAGMNLGWKIPFLRGTKAA